MAEVPANEQDGNQAPTSKSKTPANRPAIVCGDERPTDPSFRTLKWIGRIRIPIVVPTAQD
jgi:hypothetical protein